jgi:hypothetical protein
LLVWMHGGWVLMDSVHAAQVGNLAIPRQRGAVEGATAV